MQEENSRHENGSERIEVRRCTNPELRLRCHPIVFEKDSHREVPICRICWGEEDEYQGGSLLAPCRCKGTSRYAHGRCLQTWIAAVTERRGPGPARRCDICKACYSLPSDFVVRESPLQWARRHTRDTYMAIVQHPGPIGPAIHAFAVSAWMYSVLSGSYGALLQCSNMPRLLMQARRDPSALRQLVPRFAAAAALEPLLATQDWIFYAETAIMYGIGWTVDAVARALEATALLSLPSSMHSLAAALLLIPKAFGFALQAFDLALMSLFGGGAAGFLQGAAECASTPFRVMALLAKGSAALFSGLAAFLKSSGRGPEAVANLLTRNQRRQMVS